MWPFSRKSRHSASAPPAEPNRWRSQQLQRPLQPIQHRSGPGLDRHIRVVIGDDLHIRRHPANPDGEEEVDLDDWEDEYQGEPPSFSRITLQLLPLPDDGHVAVVGESHYQQALSLVCQGKVSGDDFDSHIPVTAVLVPEPENKWDGNAVRIDVRIDDQTVKVGYLSSEIAKKYQPELLKLRDKGFLCTCPAYVAGGGDRNYGIYLHVIYPEHLPVATGSEDSAIAKEHNGTALLRNDWSCTVTKEEDHQDALRRYAPTGTQESRAVIASLGFCVIKNGKYKGHDAIEVRLGADRVGQLTYAMTRRYADIVSSVLNRGLVPTCEAITMNTPKGVQIELRMPQDPARNPKRLDLEGPLGAHTPKTAE